MTTSSKKEHACLFLAPWAVESPAPPSFTRCTLRALRFLPALAPIRVQRLEVRVEGRDAGPADELHVVQDDEGLLGAPRHLRSQDLLERVDGAAIAALRVGQEPWLAQLHAANAPRVHVDVHGPREGGDREFQGCAPPEKDRREGRRRALGLGRRVRRYHVDQAIPAPPRGSLLPEALAQNVLHLRDAVRVAAPPALRRRGQGREQEQQEEHRGARDAGVGDTHGHRADLFR